MNSNWVLFNDSNVNPNSLSLFLTTLQEIILLSICKSIFEFNVISEYLSKFTASPFSDISINDPVNLPFSVLIKIFITNRG